MSESKDQIIIAGRNETPPVKWTVLAERVGMTRDKTQRRYAQLLAEPEPCDPVPPMDAAHPDILERDERIAVLEGQVTRQAAQLKATHKSNALFKEVAGVVRQTTAPLTCKAAHRPAPRKDGAALTDADMVLMLSDEHADAVVGREATWGLERYDFDVFRARLTRLRDMIAEYATVHLPAHKFDRLYVLKLGDGVNGDIHGGAERNHFRNTIKAALALGDVEAEMIHSLAPLFPGGVHVVGVSGNHPRRSVKKDYHGPQDNFDYLVGVQMSTRLAADIAAGRVTVTLPESWSAFVSIRSKVWVCNHGDDVTSYTGLPWVGFDRRSNRVQTQLAKVGQRADYFTYGHYHTPSSFVSAGGESWHNGAFPATDDYALGRLAVAGTPRQWLFVVGDRGIILPIPIDLRDEATEALLSAGQYEPALGRSLSLDVVAPQDTGGFSLIEAGS